jgi:hypothetical protein
MGDPASKNPLARTSAAAIVTPAARAHSVSLSPTALRAADRKVLLKGARQRDHVLSVFMDRNSMRMQAHLFDPLTGHTEVVWVELSRGPSRPTNPSAYVASVVHPGARPLAGKS